MPIVLELKEFGVGEVRGLLPRWLMDPRGCGLQEGVVARLREGRPCLGSPTRGPTRLVVFCDGFDELRGQGAVEAFDTFSPQVGDFVTALCGGAGHRWPPSVLKVVVTSRESRLAGRGAEDRAFGSHTRLMLLPFTRAKVRACGCGCGCLCVVVRATQP